MESIVGEKISLLKEIPSQDSEPPRFRLGQSGQNNGCDLFSIRSRAYRMGLGDNVFGINRFFEYAHQLTLAGYHTGFPPVIVNLSFEELEGQITVRIAGALSDMVEKYGKGFGYGLDHVQLEIPFTEISPEKPIGTQMDMRFKHALAISGVLCELQAHGFNVKHEGRDFSYEKGATQVNFSNLYEGANICMVSKSAEEFPEAISILAGAGLASPNYSLSLRLKSGERMHHGN